MKTLTLAAIRCSLMFTAVAALSLAYPASVQAVPTTYQYTGNPFTRAFAPYTTSDFVTAMVTLAGPLGANMPLTTVTPTAFTMTDGVQTISNHNATFVIFQFATDATADITDWEVVVKAGEFPAIGTFHNAPLPQPATSDIAGHAPGVFATNSDNPGEWSVHASAPDAGSTLSLMTLTLMALGLVARRFQRAAA